VVELLWEQYWAGSIDYLPEGATLCGGSTRNGGVARRWACGRVGYLDRLGTRKASGKIGEPGPLDQHQRSHDGLLCRAEFFIIRILLIRNSSTALVVRMLLKDKI
jgi:hypothetical protein